MEELAEEGYFDGILDLATHELADHLMNGYCGNIGPHRFEPISGKSLPRLVLPWRSPLYRWHGRTGGRRLF